MVSFTIMHCEYKTKFPKEICKPTQNRSSALEQNQIYHIYITTKTRGRCTQYIQICLFSLTLMINRLILADTVMLTLLPHHLGNTKEMFVCIFQMLRVVPSKILSTLLWPLVSRSLGVLIIFTIWFI